MGCGIAEAMALVAALDSPDPQTRIDAAVAILSQVPARHGQRKQGEGDEREGGNQHVGGTVCEL